MFAKEVQATKNMFAKEVQRISISISISTSIILTKGRRHLWLCSLHLRRDSIPPPEKLVVKDLARYLPKQVFQKIYSKRYLEKIFQNNDSIFKIYSDSVVPLGDSSLFRICSKI